MYRSVEVSTVHATYLHGHGPAVFSVAITSGPWSGRKARPERPTAGNVSVRSLLTRLTSGIGTTGSDMLGCPGSHYSLTERYLVLTEYANSTSDATPRCRSAYIPRYVRVQISRTTSYPSQPPLHIIRPRASMYLAYKYFKDKRNAKKAARETQAPASSPSGRPTDSQTVHKGPSALAGMSTTVSITPLRAQEVADNKTPQVQLRLKQITAQYKANRDWFLIVS